MRPVSRNCDGGVVMVEMRNGVKRIVVVMEVVIVEMVEMMEMVGVGKVLLTR